ncbi:MAG TPA: extracellular solute-binding protein [Actinomycetota bacterium]
MKRPGARPVRAWRHVIALAVVALVAAACSGADPQPQPQGGGDGGDIGSLGDVTLIVWDQEVRGGQNQQIEQLNAEFMEQYPNVTIERVAKSFDDLFNTVKLAVSGPNPPDVVQANQGRSIMGALVEAGLLQPLDDYAEQYGWGDRYSEGLLQLNSFSPDGQTFGEGSLYGLSQVGEIVGVFYNRQKLADLGLEIPATFADFEAALAAAKEAGEVPIQFGNLDAWPGIHEFQAVQNAGGEKEALRSFLFGREEASFDTPENLAAAAKLQEWTDAGYFTPDFGGIGYDDAWAAFAEGEGVFLITGTWLNPDLADAMGDDLGFFLMPSESGESPLALGGEGLPFAMTANSEHPQVAAAYLDHITSPHAMEVIVETGGLPAVALPNPDVPEGSSLADIFAAWEQLNSTDGIVSYLDYATPTMYDTFSASVQELMAERVTPEEFVGHVQSDFEEFLGGS